MSGLSRFYAEDFKSKEVGMKTRDKSESDFQNEEDVPEDVKDANSRQHVGIGGNLVDSMPLEEWEDAVEEMTGIEAAVVEGSHQMSQTQMTEGAIGGCQQSETTEGDVGGSQQSKATEGTVRGSQQSETTDGDVGGSQQSKATEGAVGGSQQSKATEGAVGGSQQSKATEGAVGGSQQSKATEGAVGGSQQSKATEGAVGGSQQSKATEGAVGGSQQSKATEGAVGGSQQNSKAAKRVFLPLIPRSVPKPTDPSEVILQSKFIEEVSRFEGPPVSPNEEFELQWIVYQDELHYYLTQGMVPQDTVASAGIDEKSYKQLQKCGEALQDQLYEGNILICLGNLRGFRRIFSRSMDPCLCHAFRGNPLEVLQNIYYGGQGILPEDRMLLDDPFHYNQNPDDLDN